MMTRKRVSKKVIAKAKRLVKSAGSYHNAERKYGIPKSTLNDIVLGKVETSRWVDYILNAM